MDRLSPLGIDAADVAGIHRLIVFGRKRTRSAGRTRPRRRRWLRRLLKLAAVSLLVIVLGPAAFVMTQCYGSGPSPPQLSGPLAAYPGAGRDESYTFLTLPEWLIVYGTEEYARWIAQSRPSAFPYLGATLQYWRAYDAVCEVTRGQYAFQTGYHVMLAVIGASFSVENAVKGVYENTVGRISEWLGSTDTPEDRWAAETAREYGAFMHTVPWYEFPFAARLGALWTQTPLWGAHLLRKWERRFALTAEYVVKAAYGSVIGWATGTAYDAEALHVYAHVTNLSTTIADASTAEIPCGKQVCKEVARLGEGESVLLIPRYEAFTHAALSLNRMGVHFVSIAGNDELMLTTITSADHTSAPPGTSVVAVMPLATDRRRARVALRVPLAVLPQTIAVLEGRHAIIEHLYDY